MTTYNTSKQNQEQQTDSQGQIKSEQLINIQGQREIVKTTDIQIVGEPEQPTDGEGQKNSEPSTDIQGQRELEESTDIQENTIVTEEPYRQAQIHVNYLPSSFTLRRQINFECREDEYQEIIDCTFAGDKIVFPDFNNSRLIISTVESNDIRYLPMDYYPRYITTVNSDIVAVACSRQFCIQIINISTDSVIYTFSTQSDCYALSYSDDKLYVNIGDITVMDLDGHVIRKLPSIEGNISHLTFDRNRLIYSDSFTLFCCDLNGHIIWELVDETYNDLCGVTTDSKGNVYVANTGYGDGNKVLVVPADGRQYIEILCSVDGLSNPIAIDFDKNKNRMVVRNHTNENNVILLKTHLQSTDPRNQFVVFLNILYVLTYCKVMHGLYWINQPKFGKLWCYCQCTRDD